MSQSISGSLGPGKRQDLWRKAGIAMANRKCSVRRCWFGHWTKPYKINPKDTKLFSIPPHPKKTNKHSSKHPKIISQKTSQKHLKTPEIESRTHAQKKITRNKKNPRPKNAMVCCRVSRLSQASWAAWRRMKRQKSRSNPSALASHLSGYSSVFEENGDFFAIKSH